MALPEEIKRERDAYFAYRELANAHTDKFQPDPPAVIAAREEWHKALDILYPPRQQTQRPQATEQPEKPQDQKRFYSGRTILTADMFLPEDRHLLE